MGRELGFLTYRTELLASANASLKRENRGLDAKLKAERALAEALARSNRLGRHRLAQGELLEVPALVSRERARSCRIQPLGQACEGHPLWPRRGRLRGLGALCAPLLSAYLFVGNGCSLPRAVRL